MDVRFDKKDGVMGTLPRWLSLRCECKSNLIVNEVWILSLTSSSRDYWILIRGVLFARSMPWCLTLIHSKLWCQGYVVWDIDTRSNNLLSRAEYMHFVVDLSSSIWFYLSLFCFGILALGWVKPMQVKKLGKWSWLSGEQVEAV